jgi:hypothetical protein
MTAMIEHPPDQLDAFVQLRLPDLTNAGEIARESEYWKCRPLESNRRPARQLEPNRRPIG